MIVPGEADNGRRGDCRPRQQALRREIIGRYGSLQHHRRFSGSVEEYRRLGRVYRLLYGRHLPADRGARLLELGCGSGHLLYSLRQAGYRDLTGVDASPEQVDSCRRLGVGDIIEADAAEFVNAPGDSYHMILARHLIEHLPLVEAVSLLRGIRRRLLPGGRVMLVTPNALSPWGSFIRFDDLTHERIYSPDSLAALMELAGFNGVRVFPEPPVAYDLRSAVRTLLFRMRHSWLKLAFAIENGLGRERAGRLIFTPAIIGTGEAPLGERDAPDS